MGIFGSFSDPCMDSAFFWLAGFNWINAANPGQPDEACRFSSPNVAPIKMLVDIVIAWCYWNK